MTTRRALTERLRTNSIAQRIARRGQEVGAPQLVRLLIEYGGQFVPRTPELEAEYERLAHWFPMDVSDEGYRLPADLCVSMYRVKHHERLFLTSLLAQLAQQAREELEALCDHVGVAFEGSIPGITYRLSEALLRDEHGESRVTGRIGDWPHGEETLAELAAAAGRLGAVRAKDLQSVRLVSLSGDIRAHFDGIPVFELELDDGSRHRVIAREWAETLGVSFPLPNTSETKDQAAVNDPVKLAQWEPISAILTFNTSRAAEEAMKDEAFFDMTRRFLDDRRVALKAGVDVDQVCSLLEERGFFPSAGL